MNRSALKSLSRVPETYGTKITVAIQKVWRRDMGEEADLDAHLAHKGRFSVFATGLDIDFCKGAVHGWANAERIIERGGAAID